MHGSARTGNRFGWVDSPLVCIVLRVSLRPLELRTFGRSNVKTCVCFSVFHFRGLERERKRERERETHEGKGKEENKKDEKTKNRKRKEKEKQREKENEQIERDRAGEKDEKENF